MLYTDKQDVLKNSSRLEYLLKLAHDQINLSQRIHRCNEQFNNIINSNFSSLFFHAPVINSTLTRINIQC